MWDPWPVSPATDPAVEVRTGAGWEMDERFTLGSPQSPDPGPRFMQRITTRMGAQVFATLCGIDMSPADEPGHYTCERWGRELEFPHHECGYHHHEDIDCETVAAVEAIDEQLWSYAR